MPLSAVFYAFLARLAAGSLVALLPLWGLRAAERHVRFQLLFTACVALGAAALHAGADLGTAESPRGAAAFVALGGTLPGAALVTGVLCLAANALFGTFRRRAARAVVAVACVTAVAGVLGSVRLGPGGADAGPGALLVLTLSALLGGIVMGAIHNAMILGHFYLMIRGLPLDALKRAGRTVGVALLAKIAVFAGVLLFWHGAAAVLLEREVLWTTWRVTFGFVGPLVLLWMVKDTVRLQHTQAATGLLYVAVAFALMGELAAVYLELAGGVPA